MNFLIIAVTIAALSMQVLSKDTIETLTDSPVTDAPVTDAPVTKAPVTKVTTKAPTKPTSKPTTAKPTTAKPTTAKPTTAKPTTAKPTTKPTTAKPTTAKPTTAKPTTAKPTTAKPTTKPTTAKPTTKPTTAKPTTKPTTAKPTTKPTTAKPTTAKPTTAKPTTAKPTNSTTAKPTNSTTAIPTTLKPTPSPTHLHFTVQDVGKKDCLWLDGTISLNVSDETSARDLKQPGALASGKCSPLTYSNETSYILMKWGNVNSLKITFTGGSPWYMSKIEVNTAKGSKSASSEYTAQSNGRLFQAASNHSYTCPEDNTLLLKGAGKYNITVDFKKVSMQPFSANKGFINAVTCPTKVNPNPDSSVVPIAVGCALAGLIVIVLIAYLIGRRKGGNRGYQKV